MARKYTPTSRNTTPEKKDDFDFPESVECHANGLMPPRDHVDPGSVEMNASDIGLTLGGLRVLGYIDLPYVDDNEIAIIDWKTRSRFDYCPDAVELLDDVQGKFYAWIAFEMLKKEGIDRIP